MMNSSRLMLLAGLAAGAIPPVANKRIAKPFHYEPGVGLSAESAIRIAKAEAKRQRKAKKRAAKKGE